VLAIRYDTTTHETRSMSPRSEAIAGSAVATIVWSATARNIGSITEGKTVQNNDREEVLFEPSAASAVGVSVSTGVRSSFIE